VRHRLLVFMLLTALMAGLATPSRGTAAAPRIPLVLIHGLAGSPETTWAWALPWLAQRGYVQGTSVFTINLRAHDNEGLDLGLLADAAFTADEIRRILSNTGAAQVDLVGNSRGGLIVRMLAEGDTAPLIHRAVTIDAPHQGVLSTEALYAMLDHAKVDPSYRTAFNLPEDIKAGSDALKTIADRETRFADRRVPSLAVGSTFQDGMDPVLSGHDGFVPLSSQLAWPGAKTFTTTLGPTPEALKGMIAVGAGVLALAQNIPHVVSPESETIWSAVYDFLTATSVPQPTRACEPTCNDWADLTGHWSEATVRPMLPEYLPYVLGEMGTRLFQPNAAISRAEFVYGLDKAIGVSEALGQTAFADLRGHWSLGYVQAAVSAKLVSGVSPTSFGPDKRLTRAEAATLIVRAKKYSLAEGPSRFIDARGHWAEKFIEAAASGGIIKGDDRGFRPNDPLTRAEAAVILSRSFPR